MQQYIFYALIALFFGYLLFDAFGKPVGRTKPEPRQRREGSDETSARDKDQAAGTDAQDAPYEPYAYTGKNREQPARQLPEKFVAPGADMASIQDGLGEIEDADPDFNVEAFLPRASRALEIVLSAYQDRNREDLKGLLSDELYAAFDGAISAAEDSGDNSKLTLISLGDPRLVSAGMEDTNSVIKLSIRLEQLISQRDADAADVDGLGESVIETSDYTFIRDVNSHRRTWQLRAIEEA